MMKMTRYGQQGAPTSGGAKLAKLPDGSYKEFPAEIDDNEMHKQVKQHMGIPIPPDPAEIARQEDMQMAGGRNQALMALAQSAGQLTQAVARLCADQQTTQRLLVQVAGQISKLEQTVGSAARQVVDAVMAPSRQEIERGEDGKIVATNITKGMN